MRKHIIYLVAGLIAGLILGVVISAGGQPPPPRPIEESETYQFLKLLLDKLPTQDAVKELSKLFSSLYDSTNRDIRNAQKSYEIDVALEVYNMEMSKNIFIQNQRILLQNQRIIELLEEIRDK